MSFKRNYIAAGTGKPFIFQHGLGANATQPQGLLGEVSGYQLISMDCPGHGKSELPHDYMPSFDRYTRDVMALMEYLGIDQAVLGGISMGSGISLNLALRSPEKVKALVLVRPAWMDETNPENLRVLDNVIDYVNQQYGREDFEENGLLDMIRKELPAAADSIMGLFSRDQQESTEDILEGMINDSPFKSMESLKNISVPTMVIGNDDDPLHPWEFAEEIAATIPGASLHKVVSRYVDDITHKQQVRGIVNEFLEKYC